MESVKDKVIKILPQPTDVSCGPTCLQAVYDFYDHEITLERVIKEVKQLKDGGTLAVMLANHALKSGFKTTIYTLNIQVFDPTWFDGVVNISEKLSEQLFYKGTRRLQQATNAYLNYLSNNGELKFEDLSPQFLINILKKGQPILTGLSATYLYNSAREIPEYNVYHDTKGEAAGHFVVLCGYDEKTKRIKIADPLNPNPIKDRIQYYNIDIQRVVNAILLGILTYDANLLIIQPKNP
ncbi:MAG: C39 family peptidase [Cyclobacteriaceae bacterium]